MVAEHHIVESQPNRQPAGDADNAAWASGRIERLVTGDLDDAERLELLAWLDAEPARWRRCGLAFLEAQALRESLATDPTVAGAIAGTAVASPSQSSWLPRRRALLVVAAAVVVAFSLGWAAGHRLPGRGGDAAPVAADGPPRESGAATGHADTALAAPVAAVADSPSGKPPAPSPVPGASVTLALVRVGEGPNARDVVLPVLAGAAGNTSWDQAAGPIPDYVRRQWERQGYRVIERRQNIPVKLADGRQIEVPVERVMLTFVGQPLL